MGGRPSPKVAAYIRVSTDQQNHESQEGEIRKWLTQHGIQTARWYVDHITGSKIIRPALNQLQKDIRLGRVDTVVIYKLDRLSRSLRDGVNLIHDWCERGVRLVSVTQQIDLSGITGQMMAAMMLGLAEMERENIRERQRAGIEQAKKRGVYKGRPKGTTKGSPERARELRAKGLKIPEIGEALGVSRETVHRYLRGKQNHD